MQWNSGFLFGFFLLGLELGSFANVCIYRWPRGGSVVYPRRSHCPWCQKQISWYDNIPFISYFLLKGHCRHCASPISLRYPLVELTIGLLWLGSYLFLTKGPVEYPLGFLIGVWGFLFVLVVTTLTDLDWKIIPDQASFGLVFLGIATAPWNPFLGEGGLLDHISSALIGLLVAGGTLWGLAFGGRLVFQKEAMGGGDIKLAAGFGAFLGWKGAMAGLFLASLFGGMVVLIGLLFGFLRRNQYIPFGPFLNFGAFVAFLLRLFFPASIDFFL